MGVVLAPVRDGSRRLRPAEADRRAVSRFRRGVPARWRRGLPQHAVHGPLPLLAAAGLRAVPHGRRRREHAAPFPCQPERVEAFGDAERPHPVDPLGVPGQGRRLRPHALVHPAPTARIRSWSSATTRPTATARRTRCPARRNWSARSCRTATTGPDRADRPEQGAVRHGGDHEHHARHAAAVPDEPLAPRYVPRSVPDLARSFPGDPQSRQSAQLGTVRHRPVRQPRVAVRGSGDQQLSSDSAACAAAAARAAELARCRRWPNRGWASSPCRTSTRAWARRSLAAGRSTCRFPKRFPPTLELLPSGRMPRGPSAVHRLLRHARPPGARPDAELRDADAERAADRLANQSQLAQPGDGRRPGAVPRPGRRWLAQLRGQGDRSAPFRLPRTARRTSWPRPGRSSTSSCSMPSTTSCSGCGA